MSEEVRESMRKYGGTIIHCTRDNEGLVEVVDAQGIRFLHFGTPPRQSALSLTAPERLELSYVRAMLAGLMFTKDPDRVLILGLGGGTLATFLLRAFPECRVDAVESRATVVTVARRFFGLPEDPRLTVHVADAGAFIEAAATSNLVAYSHIFVDLFDREGLAGAVTLPNFTAALAKRLSDQGILAMNLWGSHPESYRSALGPLKLDFGEKILRLQVVGRGNVIIFGLGRALPAPHRHALTTRAGLLERRLGIEFSRFLHLLSPLKT